MTSLAVGGDTPYKRKALIIANNYPGEDCALNTCIEDGLRIYIALMHCGFEIFKGKVQENLNNKELHNIFNKFVAQLEETDIPLVIYFGHGATHSGISFIDPCRENGVTIENNEDFKKYMFDVEDAQRKIGLAVKTNPKIFILDMCPRPRE